MDSASVDRLLDILQQQIAAHQELRTVLLDQQGAIRRYDAAALERFRARGDVLAERIAQLEALRESITGPGVKITELAARLGAPRGVRLSAVAAGLKKLVMDIAAINRINRTAVSQMLNHFSAVYRILSGAGRNTAYGADGKTDERPSGAFLVDAIA